MFIVLPLTDKLGDLATVEALDIPTALNYRDAISERNEFEKYFSWLHDKKREEDEKYKKDNNVKNSFKSPNNLKSKFDISNRGSNVMKLDRPAERNKKKVAEAMESSKNYFTFLVGRGFR